jgi:hypothetical protein
MIVASRGQILTIMQKIKYNRMNKTTKHYFLSIAVLLLLPGCLQDDNSDCPRPFQVTVRAFDADRRDITTSGEVEQVILFVFNQNRQLIDAYELNTAHIVNRHPIDIRFEFGTEPEFLIFDAWANLDNRVDFGNPNSVNQREDMYVKLKRRDAQRALDVYRNTREAVQAPGDIFGGALEKVEIEYGGNEYGQSHVIDIFRKTAAVHIRTINLKGFNNNREGNYRYEIHGSVDALNHMGDFAGNLVKHVPETNFDTNNHFVTNGIYRKFASEQKSSAHQGEDILIDIYFENELIYTADKDTGGNPFVPAVGRTLNIVIDLPDADDGTAKVSVRTMVTPWNVVWEEINWYSNN